MWWHVEVTCISMARILNVVMTLQNHVLEPIRYFCIYLNLLIGNC
jgi:hypothetical protein